jgi:hypothetical protein
MPFKLHLDKDGKPQFNDKGHPFFMQDGGSEPVAIDPDGLYDQVRAKGGEAATYRKEKEELAAKLKAYDGLDPEAARKALEVAKMVEDGKLLDAGKLDELKAKHQAESAQKVSSLEKALADEKTNGVKAVQEKEQMIHNLLVKNAFSESAFLREKTVLPPDFAYASLSKHFTVEYQNGNPVVIAKDGQGNILFSTATPGQNASPEEAIRILIEQHPQRDSLLKAPAPGGGSGAQPGSGRSGVAGKTMSRVAFDALGPAAKVKTMSEGVTLTD